MIYTTCLNTDGSPTLSGTGLAGWSGRAGRNASRMIDCRMLSRATAVAFESSRGVSNSINDNDPKYWCELNSTFSPGFNLFPEPNPLIFATCSFSRVASYAIAPGNQPVGINPFSFDFPGRNRMTA